MVIETIVSLPDELAIKALFAPARFVTTYKQDCLSLRIERKGHSPLTASRTEA